MKKTLLALAAVVAVTAGSAAAQAKVHFDVYLNPGFYAPHVYSPYYEPTGYYKPKCHFVKVKVVRYDDYGYKYVTWKNKKICNKAYYGY
jgi:hypothetical protein